MTRLVKNTLTYGIGSVLNRLLTLLLLPLFTAYLTPSEYGVSSILTLFILLLLALFTLGLNTGMGPVYFEPANRGRNAAVIWSSAAVLLASVMVLQVGQFFPDRLVRLVFAGESSPDLVYLMRLALVWAGLCILASPFSLYLQFEEQSRLYSILSLAWTALALLLNIFMVVVLRRGVVGLIEAGTIAQVFNLLFYLIPALRRLKPRFELGLARTILRSSLGLIPSAVFLILLQQINKYLLQWRYGLDEVGIYTIGNNLGLVLNVLLLAFQNAWYPYFMSFFEKPDGVRVFAKIGTYFVLLYGSLSLLFYFWARPVVMVLTQAAYYRAYLAVGPSATAQVLLGLSFLLVPGVYYARKVYWISILQGGAVLVSAAASLGLIQFGSVLPAGLGFLAGYAILAFLQWFWNRWGSPVALPYEWGRIGRFGLVYVILAVPFLFDWQVNLFPAAVIALGASLLVAGLVWKAIAVEDRGYIWSIIQKKEK